MNKTELIAFLEKRYAVKKFDKNEGEKLKGVESIIKDILRLTPTSFGLQAQKFLIIKDDDIREKLREFSWGQQQITDSYMLIVFCIPTDFDKSNIEHATHRVQEVRGMDEESKKNRIAFMEDKIITHGEEI